MSIFDSLIAQFVDDVLHTLRSASLDDLTGLLGDPESSALQVEHALPSEPVLSRGADDRFDEAVRTPRPARAAPPRRAFVEPVVHHPEVHVSSEITDPAWLLSATAAPPPSRSGKMPAFFEPVVEQEASEDAAPDSSTPAAPPAPAAMPVLRAGEKMARASGGGMVIRRSKRP